MDPLRGISLRTQVSRAQDELRRLADGPFPVELKDFGAPYGLCEVDEVDLGPSAGSERSLDALLVPVGEGFSALLNEKHHYTRKRFSLAHEISHLMLARSVDGMKFQTPSCSGSAVDPTERACNVLAAQMLMPQEAFVNRASALGWELSSVLTLGTVFGTSLESTARRMVELSPIPLGFVKWSADKSKRPIHYYPPVVSPEGERIVGFDRRCGLIDIPTLCQAYTQDGIFRGTVPFEVLLARNRPPVVRPFQTESRGFGKGERRTVYSLVRLQA